MDHVWSGSRLFDPFLRIRSRRNIMFAESGSDVPFRMESWAYLDSFGRETLTLNRTFGLTSSRRFDEYVVVVPGVDHLIIYVGSHQHLAVAFNVRTSARAGLEFRTEKQRLPTWLGAFRFPLALSGEAYVHEWYDQDLGKFRIDGRAENRFLGGVFSFNGSFESRLELVPSTGVPAHVKPIREENRW